MKAHAVRVEGRELMPVTEPAGAPLGIYGRTNLLVVAAQLMAWAALLTVMDQSSLHWSLRAAALIVFCMMMQGVFTMLHEFCHRNAHADARLNYLIGWVSSTLFGTAPTLLQVQHWGHHRRNRTESERAEFIHEDEVAWLKTARYYFAILGGIWLGCFVFSLLAPLLRYSVSKTLTRNRRFNGFAASFDEFTASQWRRMQVEGVVFFGWWCALVSIGPWSWQTLLVAYAGFAFSWSSLQWVYHVNTPIHVVEGAYNLRLPLPLRLLFLNFNYNLTHHRHPYLPWQALFARSDAQQTQPLWYRYLRVFRPPRLFPPDLSVLDKRFF